MLFSDYLINRTQIDSQLTEESLQPVATQLESTETLLGVAEAIAALPLDYRQVLLFKYVEEMNVIEISQVMKRSPKAIDGLLTRARKLFKRNLFIIA